MGGRYFEFFLKILRSCGCFIGLRLPKFYTNLIVNYFQGQVSKRAKLEVSVMLEPASDSFVSTSSQKLSARVTGNLQSDSSKATEMRNIANMRSFNMQKIKGWFCL